MTDAGAKWAALQSELEQQSDPPVSSVGRARSDRTGNYLMLSAGVLDVLSSSLPADAAVGQILALVQKATAFDSVGVRLETNGDYPYRKTLGFTDDFVQAECSLCRHAEDGSVACGADGLAELDCMCGAVIRGHGNPKQPWFTSGGSFWTTSTTQLLSDPGYQPWRVSSRQRCHAAGYESMALVPLRSAGSIIGLLQLNDRQRDKLTLQDVRMLERIGTSVGIALGQRQTEERLRTSESVLRATLESLPFDFFLIGEDGHYSLQNRVCRQHWGDVVGRTPAEMAPNAEVRERWESNNRRAFSGETVRGVVEYAFDGKPGWFFNIISPVRHDGRISGILGLNLDITERLQAEASKRELEAQLQRVDKLESLGTMAGRLAHDFNNLLAGIEWNAQLALRHVAPEVPAHGHLADITDIVDAAAELTEQLRAYSGKVELVRYVVDLNALLDETQALIRSALRERAEIDYALSDVAMPVQADQTQLQQVLTNLVVNASEAMGEASGRVTIAAQRVHCDRSRLDRLRPDTKLAEGEYACLEVIDDGPGMDPATAERAFDPFFSTKPLGRGLGLATVQGVIHGHGGAIEVQSQVGHGTRVIILLPLVESEE
jgi:PAS domain S-box-containing protein